MKRQIAFSFSLLFTLLTLVPTYAQQELLFDSGRIRQALPDQQVNHYVDYYDQQKNVDSVTVTLHRVTDELAVKGNQIRVAADQLKQVKSWTVNNQNRNQRYFYQNVDLGKLGMGVYVVTAPHGNQKEFKWLFVVSDVTTLARRDGERVGAWVFDAKSGKPVTDATVWFGDRPKRERDEMGRYVTTQKPNSGAPILVQVGEQWDVAWFYDEGVAAQAKMPYAVLDRFFYRPNDSLHLVGFAPSSQFISKEATIEFTKIDREKGGSGNPQTKTVSVLKKSVALDRFGAFETTEKMDKEFSAGAYQVTVKVGDAPFTVPFFVVAQTDSLRHKGAGVQIELNSTTIAMGEKVRAKLRAEQFAGEPMRRVTVDWAVWQLNYEQPINAGEFSWFFAYVNQPYYYGYSYPVLTGTTQTDEKGETVVEFNAPQAGIFRLSATASQGSVEAAEGVRILRVTAGESKTTVQPVAAQVQRGRFRGGGATINPFKPMGDGSAELRVTPDKDFYHAGETINVTIESSLPNAPILFTAYTHKVYHEQLLTAKNGQATVQLTTPSDTPNLMLDVVMVKDRQLRRHQRLVLTGLEKKILNVSVEHHQIWNRPGTRSYDEAAIRTADLDGKPVSARVLVGAVAGREVMPDDIRTFFYRFAGGFAQLRMDGKLGSPYSQADAWGRYHPSQIRWRSWLNMGSLNSGGGSDFVFSKVVTTNANGSASVSLPLTSNGLAETRRLYHSPFTIIALALDETGRVGQGQTTIDTSPAFTAELIAPDFLRVGDRGEVRAVVENHLTHEQAFSAELKGDNLKIERARQTLTLQAGERRLIRWRVTAGRVGEAKVSALISPLIHLRDAPPVYTETMTVRPALTDATRNTQYAIRAIVRSPSRVSLDAAVAPGEFIEVELKAKTTDKTVTFTEPLPAGFELRGVFSKKATYEVKEGTLLINAEAEDGVAQATYTLRAQMPGTYHFAGGTLNVQRIPSLRLVSADVAQSNRLRYSLVAQVVNPEDEPRSATVAAALVDPNDKVLDRSERKVTLQPGENRIEFSPLHPPTPSPLHLKVRAYLANEARPVSDTAPLSALLGNLAVRLLGQSEYVAGTKASVRLVTLNERTGEPIRNAGVKLLLNPSGEVPAKPVAEGVTDDSGSALVQFDLPKQRGKAELVATVHSIVGQTEVKQGITINTPTQTMLTTDKPLYQPGQTIHIRALVLRKPNLIPASLHPCILEVFDPKGNRVFKQKGSTNPFGIAAADFSLANEVNMGEYAIRATVMAGSGFSVLGSGDKNPEPRTQTPEPIETAERKVTVKRYVLPKFKIALTTDKAYYMAGETLKGKAQVDYFFGKPVAGGEVELKLSTYVDRFVPVAEIKGKTNEKGLFEFEQKLPDYFVGQPLTKGDATLMIEANVTDTANHKETKSDLVTVAREPINIVVLPEGGSLKAGVENMLYVVTTYPDGKPAKTRLTLQTSAVGDALTAQTDDAGIGVVKLTAPSLANVKFTVTARDNKGNVATRDVALETPDAEHSILLRTDKAIYKIGEPIRLTVLQANAAAMSRYVYVDAIHNKQTVLTKSVELSGGRGEETLNLMEGLFGTLELHAYKILSNGDIVRDSRIVYVQPANDLNISVTAHKTQDSGLRTQDSFLPGENATLKFSVKDAKGSPVLAAIGVNIVDESVFALEEQQPGLLKVYFTLEKELLQPRYQLKVGPPPNFVAPLALTEAEERDRQAKIVFAAANVIARYSVDQDTRRQKIEKAQQQLQRLSQAIQNSLYWSYYDETTGRHDYKKLQDYIKQHGALPIEVEGLKWLTTVKPPRGQQSLAKAEDLMDSWGNEIRFRLVLAHQQYGNLPTELLSLGADGVAGTPDDIRVSGYAYLQWEIFQQLAQARRASSSRMSAAQVMATLALTGTIGASSGETGLLQFAQHRMAYDRDFGNASFAMDALESAAKPMAQRAASMPSSSSAMGGGGMPGMPGMGGGDMAKGKRERMDDKASTDAGAEGGEEFQAPARVRSYFPETLYSNAAILTNEDGTASVTIPMADSITTWRISAMANTQSGLLGSLNAPLKVFQDFFADIDLPVALTQNDEVTIPVAVYNYLPEAQKVKLVLEKADWFRMVDDAMEKTLTLQPNQVTSVTFRIKALRVGNQPLTVTAYGTKMSDAIRRTIEIVPDGKEIVTNFNDRLGGSMGQRVNGSMKVAQTFTVHPEAIEGANKLFVKLYPGVFSQVVEGLDSMLRMPFG
jgi:uncharacterized protein YfaS (alpha-2-macroglobulin family)